MKIMVILPAEKSAYPPQEVELRKGYLQKLLSPGTQMEIGFMSKGAIFKRDLTAADIEWDEEIVGPAREAEKAGFDAVMIHCVYDPGLVYAHQKLKIPVIGPGEATFALLKMMGKKFGVLAPNDALIPTTNEMIESFGLSEHVTSMGALNIQLPDAHTRSKELKNRAVELGKKAVEEGAEIILPFGLALIPTHLSCQELQKELGVPVINPAEIGLKMTELIGQLSV